jgi:hypothetical protein
MFVKEEVVEDGAKMAKWVNGKWEECHIIIIYVTNDAVAVGDDTGVGIVSVYPVEFPSFVNLEMFIGGSR